MSAPHQLSRWLPPIVALIVAACTHAQTAPSFPADTTPTQQSPSPRVPPRITARQHENAEAAYLSGAKHLNNSAFQEAENDFARAVVLDPTRSEYLSALTLAREHRVTDLLQKAAERRTSDPAAADKLVDQASAIDNTNPRVIQHEESRLIASGLHAPPPIKTRLAGSIVLQPNNTTRSFHEHNDIRALADEFASSYGLRAAIDPELATKQIRIDMDDVGFAEGMHVFNLVSDTMFVPLDAHTFILAQDTQANRDRYQRLEEETFFLPGFTADQMKDFVSIAQNIFDLKQVTMQPGQNALVVRGQADVMEAVERTFNDLLQGGSDVVLDLKLYEVNKSRVRNLGLVTPQSISGFSLAAEAQSLVSQNSALISQLIASGVIPSTASQVEIAAYLVFVAGLGQSAQLTNSFLKIGGGVTTAVLSAGNVPMINLALNQSDARTLDDVQLRGSDRQRITLKVGTRYPIQTSLFSDVASSTTTGLSGLTVNGVSLSSLLSQYLGTNSIGSSATIPQVQYEDLGLVVDTTPRILLNSDVGMHLETKISALSGTALNGIPILGSRQFTADLTLHDGETAMVISNSTRDETAAVSGLPGLSEVPGFQSTTNRNGSVMTSDLVLMITPHIVRHGHTNGKGPYIPLPSHADDD